MEAIEAILNRRATRSFNNKVVHEGTIKTLIDAAIHAPSALNKQPWAFLVIQDEAVLKEIADEAQRLVRESPTFAQMAEPMHHKFQENEYDVFHNAGTLIVILAKPHVTHADWDCCFAGQNLMIAARAMGLGTCPIGFALQVLDHPKMRTRLGIPEGYLPILPIAVGHTNSFPEMPKRVPAEVVKWFPSTTYGVVY